jgi:hypothetical protein
MGIIKNYHDKKWTLQFLDALYNSIDMVWRVIARRFTERQCHVLVGSTCCIIPPVHRTERKAFEISDTAENKGEKTSIFRRRRSRFFFILVNKKINK